MSRRFDLFGRRDCGMKKRPSIARWFAGLLGGVFLSVFLSAAGPIAPTPFGCDAPGLRVCFFSIQFAFGGVRSFSLRPGERLVETGVTPGVDRYQISLDVPNLGDVNRCRVLNVQGHPCRTKLVEAGYND